jgi:riboflavin synthase
MNGILELSTLAEARLGWCRARVAEKRAYLEEMEDKHERHPVPGIKHKRIEAGRFIREMDIRIDELTRLLQRTEEERLTR